MECNRDKQANSNKNKIICCSILCIEKKHENMQTFVHIMCKKSQHKYMEINCLFFIFISCSCLLHFSNNRKYEYFASKNGCNLVNKMENYAQHKIVEILWTSVILRNFISFYKQIQRITIYFVEKYTTVITIMNPFHSMKKKPSYTRTRLEIEWGKEW